MLEIGKTYRRNDGGFVTIGGLTKAHKDYVWSIQGDWYDQKTGRFVSSGQSGYILLRLDGPRSISDHKPIEDENGTP